MRDIIVHLIDRAAEVEIFSIGNLGLGSNSGLGLWLAAAEDIECRQGSDFAASTGFSDFCCFVGAAGPTAASFFGSVSGGNGAVSWRWGSWLGDRGGLGHKGGGSIGLGTSAGGEGSKIILFSVSCHCFSSSSRALHSF